MLSERKSLRGIAKDEGVSRGKYKGIKKNQAYTHINCKTDMYNSTIDIARHSLYTNARLDKLLQTFQEMFG